MSYLVFVLGNPRFLAFGFLLTWFSSFGHTFVIALFGADIRAEFGLSHGGFGLVYSLATLASALCVIWLGRKIDQVDLRRYSAFVCAGLVAACFLVAAAPSVVLLGLALFALRLAGPGLTVHTAITSMGRYFEGQRGRAVSIASLGQTAGEALFPLTAVALIAVLGWRGTWVAFGAAGAVVLMPLVIWLLEGHEARHRRLLERTAAGATDAAWQRRQWSRKEVLRDPRFYLILPATTAHLVVLSGLFFHQVHLAESKGWSLAWLASCFIGYAIAKVATALLLGPLVDRVGATRLLPYYMLPMGLALLALATFEHPGVALVYMVGAGTSTGAWISISGAMWAEIYGVAHLGAIRALVQALILLAAALSPAAMGWLIDLGVTMEAIAVICLGFGAAAIALLMVPAVRSNLHAPER